MQKYGLKRSEKMAAQNEPSTAWKANGIPILLSSSLMINELKWCGQFNPNKVILWKGRKIFVVGFILWVERSVRERRARQDFLPEIFLALSAQNSVTLYFRRLMILQKDNVTNYKGLHRRPSKNSFLILLLVQVKWRQDSNARSF